MYSDLAEGIIQTPFCNDRNGQTITRITPHHMACVQSGKACAEYEQRSNNSANYCIGVDGDIWCACDEDYRAWTSGGTDIYGNEGRDSATGMTGRENDYQAITIECSNCEVGGEWALSEATWNSLVKLCADICKRYGFRLNYTGAGDGTLTTHRMFAATSCPGEWLNDRLVLLEQETNAILDGKDEPEEENKMTREEKEMMIKMEFNEWLHRDPDDQTLKDLCETIPDDVSYEEFNTSALDEMLENSNEARHLHRIDAIKSFYKTLLGREADDEEAYGWSQIENGSLRNIYKYIANSDEAQNYAQRKFTV